ncbi:MAG: 50S ribosomal protein L9 [Rickettsiales bacterium]|mgnify:CR=1 FL=1|nr:50S ribosomal protein L9 [Rickettsiales bacterium]|tara:strand:+ start:248 stop:820 length:573 start_codon:yes stop_codon:yes gene_type:complete
MEVILLERVARLGGIGDTVKVKNGYGRNFLIPQGKALRASEANIKRFEAQRDVLEKQNQERLSEAKKLADKMEGLIVTVVRQASDDGKLYGSVSVRDIGDAMEAEGFDVDRSAIDLNAAIKSLGLYEVTVSPHPEVPVVVKVHVARNADSPIPQEMLDDEPEETPVAQAAAEDEDTAEAVDAEEDEETAA